MLLLLLLPSRAYFDVTEGDMVESSSEMPKVLLKAAAAAAAAELADDECTPE